MAVLANRWYEWLYQFKTMEGLASDDTSDETKINRILAGASRLIEERTGDRFFYPTIATKTFNYQGRYDLNLETDLISLTSITNGDGSTITVGNVLLYPLDTSWKRWLHLNPGDGEPFAYDYEPNQAISIAGVWGYQDVQELSSQIIASPALTTSATQLKVTDATSFDVGQMIKIESEAIFISARLNSTTMTIARAQLGTTAATHSIGTAIYIYRAPEAIELATSIIAARMFKRWEAVWADSMGSGPSRRTYTKGFPPEVIDLIMPYTWIQV